MCTLYRNLLPTITGIRRLEGLSVVIYVNVQEYRLGFLKSASSSRDDHTATVQNPLNENNLLETTQAIGAVTPLRQTQEKKNKRNLCFLRMKIGKKFYTCLADTIFMN